MLASNSSMLASKGSMLSSKGNMLSCMILLAIEVDARVQLLARIRDHAVSRCTQATTKESFVIHNDFSLYVGKTLTCTASLVTTYLDLL